MIGDSHARIMMSMVEPTVQAGHLTAGLFVSGGCPWSTYEPNVEIPAGRACADFRERLSAFLDLHAKDYDAVLTTARLTTMRGSREERAWSTTDLYCDEETCPVVIGGVNVYFESNHLTVTYARTLAPYLHRELAEHGIRRERFSGSMRP